MMDIRVCPDCFHDSGLQRRIAEIRPDFEDLPCEFHRNKKGVPVNAVAEIVDEVFQNSFCYAGYDPRGCEPVGLELAAAVAELVGVDDWGVAEALAEALIETEDYWPASGDQPFYSDEIGYERFDHADDFHSGNWRLFRNDILHGQRFFNMAAMRRLESIFDGLHFLRNERGHPAVYRLSPKDKAARFFRARVCNDEGTRESIISNAPSQLGPPPENLSRPGRMNPSGILAFYGAFDHKTCIAELRPSVGEYIASVEFSLRRPILVLDTTMFSSRPKDINKFAKTHLKRVRLWKFMSKFMDEIARPCLPNDEHLDYVPTQVVCEYLANHHKLKRDGAQHTIDAIIYRSAQNGGGKNIAIFGGAGNVHNPDNTSSKWPDAGVRVAALQCNLSTLKVTRVSGVSHDYEDHSYLCSSNQMDDF